MRIETLTRQQCIDVLSVQRLARLACAKNGQPYVVPIHYAFEGHYLYSFSLTGQKIEWMRGNPMVCVEVNEPGCNREWRSVIIKGVFEELPHLPRFERERGHAWSLISRHPNWWEPGDLKPVSQVAAAVPRHVFYRIQIKTMTGRQAIEDVVCCLKG